MANTFKIGKFIGVKNFNLWYKDVCSVYRMESLDALVWCKTIYGGISFKNEKKAHSLILLSRMNFFTR